MSLYVKNQSCDMCCKIEKPLCRITVGKIDHMICYDCLAKLVIDLADFAHFNLKTEMSRLGVSVKKEVV